jgi:hypothetical protein
VKLITKCYSDDHLTRLIEKGDKRLVKELDMCRILCDIKNIHTELNDSFGLVLRKQREKEAQKQENIHLDYDSDDEHDLL